MESLDRVGAGGSPPGETTAPPPGILERLPDGMRDKLPDELVDEHEILHAIAAPSEQAVRERLAEDNWAQNGMLAITSIEPWTILLDGRTT